MEDTTKKMKSHRLGKKKKYICKKHRRGLHSLWGNLPE